MSTELLDTKCHEDYATETVEKANVGRYMFGDNIIDKCLAFMAFFEPSE